MYCLLEIKNLLHLKFLLLWDIRLFWEYSLGQPWGFVPSGNALVFVDSHDTQREGDPILTYKDTKLYKVRHLQPMINYVNSFIKLQKII